MSTVKPLVPSFHPIDQVPSKMTSIKQPNAGQSNDVFARLPGSVPSKAVNLPVSIGHTSKYYASSDKATAKTMVSISPIRLDTQPPTKPSSAYPTQQLLLTAAEKPADATKVTAPVTCKEETSTPKGPKSSMLPPLPSPVMSGSNAVIKNLSSQFNETSASRTLQNNQSALSTKTGLPVKQETDHLAEALVINYNSYACFDADGTPIKQEEFDLGVGLDGVAIKQEEEDLDANLYASYCNSGPTFAFECLPSDTGAIDESKLDEFTLHSNGSFDGIESFVPIEPHPKIVYAAMQAPKGPNTNKPGKSNTSKPKNKKISERRAKELTNALTTGLSTPGHLDILRGRGGELDL